MTVIVSMDHPTPTPTIFQLLAKTVSSDGGGDGVSCGGGGGDGDDDVVVVVVLGLARPLRFQRWSIKTCWFCRLE